MTLWIEDGNNTIRITLLSSSLIWDYGKRILSHQSVANMLSNFTWISLKPVKAVTLFPSPTKWIYFINSTTLRLENETYCKCLYHSWYYNVHIIVHMQAVEILIASTSTEKASQVHNLITKAITVMCVTAFWMVSI